MILSLMLIAVIDLELCISSHVYMRSQLAYCKAKILDGAFHTMAFL